METLIGIIVLLAVFWLPSAIENYTFNHRTLPDNRTIDYQKMTTDIINGMSQSEAKRKYNRGDMISTKNYSKCFFSNSLCSMTKQVEAGI